MTSRLAALALLLAALALPYAVIVAPLLSAHAAREDEFAALETQIARLAALAAMADALASQRDELAARRDSAGLLLEGGSDALAAAALQNLLKAAVAGADGELRSTQALTAVEHQGFRRIAARAVLVTDSAGLRALLHAVDSARPPLTVAALEVRGLARSHTDEAPRLDVRIDVFGHAGGGG